MKQVKKKKLTSYNAVVSEIANREGKKHQATMGDVKEIFGVTLDVLAESPEAMSVFLAQLNKRLKKIDAKKAALKKKKTKKKVTKKVKTK